MLLNRVVRQCVIQFHRTMQFILYYYSLIVAAQCWHSAFAFHRIGSRSLFFYFVNNDRILNAKSEKKTTMRCSGDALYVCKYTLCHRALGARCAFGGRSERAAVASIHTESWKCVRRSEQAQWTEPHSVLIYTQCLRHERCENSCAATQTYSKQTNRPKVNFHLNNKTRKTQKNLAGVRVKCKCRLIRCDIVNN